MWKLSKISADESVVTLGTDSKIGLTNEEASLRSKIHGENELPKEEKVYILFCMVY